MFLGFGNKERKTDHDLINAFRKTGNTSPVGVLFERYSHLVFGVCVEYLHDEEESKDAVLSIFEQLLSDLKKHEIENFKGWLFKVAKNYCLLKIRSRKGAQKRNAEYLLTEKEALTPDEGDLVLKQQEEQTYLDHMKEAVNRLEEGQKICVDLFYLKEKSYKEISASTGFTLNQVKSYIQNGKRNLKLLLTEPHEKTSK